MDGDGVGKRAGCTAHSFFLSVSSMSVGRLNPLWCVGLSDTSHHRAVIDTRVTAHPAGICGAQRWRVRRRHGSGSAFWPLHYVAGGKAGVWAFYCGVA